MEHVSKAGVGRVARAVPHDEITHRTARWGVEPPYSAAFIAVARICCPKATHNSKARSKGDGWERRPVILSNRRMTAPTSSAGRSAV